MVGATDSVEGTLKGNKAHGRTGPGATGNGRDGATDPTAEQSLEVDSPKGENGKEATATAMWNGCRRGEFFEGCERTPREMPGRSDDMLLAARNRKVAKQETRRTS